MWRWVDPPFALAQVHMPPAIDTAHVTRYGKMGGGICLITRALWGVTFSFKVSLGLAVYMETRATEHPSSDTGAVENALLTTSPLPWHCQKERTVTAGDRESSTGRD